MGNIQVLGGGDMTLSDSKIALAMARQQLSKTQLAEKAGMSRNRLNVLLNSKKSHLYQLVE